MQAKADNGVAASEQPFQLAEHSDQRGERDVAKSDAFWWGTKYCIKPEQAKNSKSGAKWCILVHGSAGPLKFSEYWG